MDWQPSSYTRHTALFWGTSSHTRKHSRNTLTAKVSGITLIRCALEKLSKNWIQLRLHFPSWSAHMLFYQCQPSYTLPMLTNYPMSWERPSFNSWRSVCGDELATIPIEHCYHILFSKMTKKVAIFIIILTRVHEEGLLIILSLRKARAWCHCIISDLDGLHIQPNPV